MGNNLVTANKGKKGAKPSDERYTPEWLIARIDTFMPGWFDPCPASYGLPLAFDGLATSWAGKSVYINPPFSNAQPWAEKFLRDEIREGLFLCPGNTDSGWFQMLRGAVPCVEMRKRLHFIFPNGEVKKNAPMGCCLFYRGERPFVWRDHFGDLGRIAELSPLDLHWRERTQPERVSA